MREQHTLINAIGGGPWLGWWTEVHCSDHSCSILAYGIHKYVALLTIWVFIRHVNSTFSGASPNISYMLGLWRIGVRKSVFKR